MNFNKKRTKFYCGKLHVTSPVRAGSSPWNGCAKRREEQEPGKRLGEGGGLQGNIRARVLCGSAPPSTFLEFVQTWLGVRLGARSHWCWCWRSWRRTVRHRERACARGHASEAPRAARSPCAGMHPRRRMPRAHRAPVCVCAHTPVDTSAPGARGAGRCREHGARGGGGGRSDRGLLSVVLFTNRPGVWDIALHSLAAQSSKRLPLAALRAAALASRCHAAPRPDHPRMPSHCALPLRTRQASPAHARTRTCTRTRPGMS